jgi:hypothetical protein
MQTPTTHSTAAVAATRTVLIPEVLDLGDIAFWLRCSRTHARRLLVVGALPGQRVARRWLVTRSALLQFLEPSRPEAAPGPAALHVVTSDEGGS